MNTETWLQIKMALERSFETESTRVSLGGSIYFVDGEIKDADIYAEAIVTEDYIDSDDLQEFKQWISDIAEVVDWSIVMKNGKLGIEISMLLLTTGDKK